MPPFHVFLLFLLSLAIPIQGMAGLLPAKAFCAAEPLAVAVDSGHSCCNDADSAVKSGKVCKTEQNCQSLGIAMLNASKQALAFANSEVMADFHLQMPLSYEPFAAWRPPNSI